MKNKILPILIISTILLSSCGVLFDAADTDESAAADTEAEAVAEEEAAAEDTAAEDAAADDSQAASESTDASAEGSDQEPYTSAENPCLPFSVLGVSLTTPFPGLPEVTEDDYSVGPEDATMTFIVYSEPQCPYCAQFDPILDDFQKAYPEDVRVVFRLRPFPETFHDKSNLASQALVAAGMQGKFQELKTFLFERQYQDTNDPEQVAMSADEFWSGLAVDDFDEWLAARVSDLGINADQLLEDMVSDEVVAKVKTFGDEASAIGITGTPTLLLNGYQWPESSRGIEIFTVYLRLLKSQDKELDECVPTVIDDSKTYSATISTTQGDISVDLYADKAPMAVNNFVYLAQQGWYDGLPILSSADFILSGDPSDTGYGGAGYAFMDEENDLTFEEPGMLAVYSIWPGYGYNGSMYFINKIALTGQESRTIFGKVTDGLDILDQIAVRDNVFDTVTDSVLDVTINEE